MVVSATYVHMYVVHTLVYLHIRENYNNIILKCTICIEYEFHTERWYDVTFSQEVIMKMLACCLQEAHTKCSETDRGHKS